MEIPITEARDRLMQLPRDLEGVATITRHGHPVLAVLPWELYEELMETLDLVADPELMEAVRRAVQKVRPGAAPLLEHVAVDLGLA